MGECSQDEGRTKVWKGLVKINILCRHRLATTVESAPLVKVLL